MKFRGIRSAKSLSWLWCLLAAVFWYAHCNLGAQILEPTTVLRTGGAEPLISQRLELPTLPELLEWFVVMDVAFTTQEVVQPDRIQDSFTVVLASSKSPAAAAFLVSMDAAAVVFKPKTPGGIELDAASFKATPIAFPVFDPNFASKSAYRLEVKMPGDLLGVPLQVHYDLFDNQDGLESAAWFRTPTVVPEAATDWLLGLGLLVLGIARWRPRGSALMETEPPAAGCRRGSSLLLAGWLAGSAAAFAADRNFELAGTPISLQDVKPQVEVTYRSMRFNRVLNVWNVEVQVRNSSQQTLRAPLLLSVESFTGTAGPLNPDGRDLATVPLPFYDLTSQVSGGVLLPGQATALRTLSLAPGSGSPVLNTRAFARLSVDQGRYALASVRTLDGAGLPLGNVEIIETGPQGQRTHRSDSDFGVATLGQAAGEHVWRFEKPGFLPVWRRGVVSSNAVDVLFSPRLVVRSPMAVELTPGAGGVLHDVPQGVEVRVGPGTFATAVRATLTGLSGQSLPGFLPIGWSPLQAFWLELETAAAAAAAVNVQLNLWDAPRTGEALTLVRWDTDRLAWVAAEQLLGSGVNRIQFNVRGGGAFAVVVADTAPLPAPPAAVLGADLMGISASAFDTAGLRASGTVDPAVSPASKMAEQVTARASITVTNLGGVLSSGTRFRSEIQERYQLQDQTRRITPRYETFVAGYQRPGDTLPATIHASFPIRPRLLLGPDELLEAVITLDVLSPTPFDGGVLEVGGGQVTLDGILVASGPGDLANHQAVRARRLQAGDFSDLAGGGSNVVAAFELSLAGVNIDRQVKIQLAGIPTNALFVLGRSLFRDGIAGIEPLERLRTGADGSLLSLEPAEGERLPGIRGSGQYVLVRSPSGHGLIAGVARDASNQPAAGLAVRVAGEPWLTFSGEGGAYRLLARAGTAAVNVADLVRGHAGEAAVSGVAAGTISRLDLGVAPSGPRVVAVTPSDGATGVARVAPVVVTFSEPINPGSLGAAGIQLLATNGQPVPSSITLNLRNTVVTLLPTAQLAPNMVHTVKVAPTIQDAAGLKLEGRDTFLFTTSTDSLNRAVVQLASFEPTNGVARMVGGPGIAEAESPVILVNATTGKTATVLSKPDGSFDNFIEADVDDDLSAVMVNRDRTRNTVSVSRQLFRDGSVGLFSGGGVLEAQSEAGPVQVIVEAGAIAHKSKFKLETKSVAEMLGLAKGTPPETGQMLGGIKIEVSGDPLKQPLDLVYPVDASALQLQPGEKLEDRAFGLCQAEEVDGVTVYHIVDRMHYENGKLVTHSPPFLGIGGSMVASPIMFNLRFSTSVTMVGRVIAAPASVASSLSVYQIVNNTPASTPPVFPVPGAIVLAEPSLSAGSGTRAGLRPGSFTAKADESGIYAYLVPFNALEGDAFAMRAVSFRFPNITARRTASAPSASEGLPQAAAHLVFAISDSDANDGTPPLLTLASGTGNYPIGEEVPLKFSLIDNQSEPFLDTFDWVRLAGGYGSFQLSDGSALEGADVELRRGAETTVAGNRKVVEYFIKVKKAAVLIGKAEVRDAKGNERVYPISLRFAQGFSAPDGDLLPHQTNDVTAPMVMAMYPSVGSMVSTVDRIFIQFSEAVKKEIETLNAVTVVGTTSGDHKPVVELAADHLSANVYIGPCDPGEEVTITLSTSIKDLSDNVFQSFSGSFRTAPAPSFSLTGTDAPIGSLIFRNHSYTLDRGDHPDSYSFVRVHHSTDRNQPAKVGELRLPAYPRTMVILPDFAYKLQPGLPTRTNTLFIVAGGLIGESQLGQWLWVVDVSDPTQPTRIAGSLATLDFTAPITALRVSQGQLYLAINPPEGGVIEQLNLQAYILGSNYRDADWDAARASGPKDGKDANGDGDYVDEAGGIDGNGDGDFSDPEDASYPADELPVPQRSTLWGLGFALVMNASRFINDFDVLQGGAVMATVFPRLGTNNARLQVLTYGGNLIGLGDTPQGAVEFSSTDLAFRVVLDRDFRLFTRTNSQVISAVAIVALQKEIRIFDLSSDPTAPRLVNTLRLPGNGGDIRALIRLGQDEYGLATTTKIFLLDRAQMGKVLSAADGDKPHPSIQQQFATGGAGRTFGLGQHSIVGLGGGLKSYLRPPRIQVMRFPTLPVLDLSTLGSGPGAEAAIRSRLNQGLGEKFLTPSPLTAYGTNYPSALETPPHPAFHYYALIHANGDLGGTLKMSFESTDAAGRRLNPKGKVFAPVMLTDQAATFQLTEAQRTVDAVKAYQLSSDKQSELYNMYLTSPFLMVREHYSQAVYDQVRGFTGRQGVYHGERLRIGFEDVPNDSVYPGLEPTGGTTGQPGMSESFRSFCADFVDSANPGFEAATPVVDGVSVQSGEFRHSSTDIFAEGRTRDLILSRTYESHSHYSGPFGKGWDFNFNRRVCEIPLGEAPPDYNLPLTFYGQTALDRVAHPGDVLMHTGDGDLKLYRRISRENNNEANRSLFASDPFLAEAGWTNKIAAYFEPPPGEFDLFVRFSDGAYVSVDPSGNQTYFHADGRLDQMVSAYSASKIVCVYRSDGKLDKVKGDAGVDLEFGYYGRTTDPGFGALDRPYSKVSHIGLVARIKVGSDNYRYEYDEEAQLIKFVGLGTKDVVYGYDANPPHQLTSIGRADGTHAPTQKIFYNAGQVTKIEADGMIKTFVGDKASAKSRFDAGDDVTLSVTTAGNQADLKVDKQGRPTEHMGTPVAFDADGRITSFGKNKGKIENIFDSNNSVYRFRGNLIQSVSGSYTNATKFDGSAWNRIEYELKPDGVRTDYAYVGKPGQKITQTTGTFIREANFNDYGAMTSETSTDGGFTFTRTVSFANGLPNGVQNGSQPAWSFSRSAGAVSQVTGGGVTLIPTFDGDQQFKSASGAGIPTLASGHDSVNGRMTSFNFTGAAGGSFGQSFTYDSTFKDRIKDTTTTDGGLPSQNLNYHYDSKGRMEKMERNGIATKLTYQETLVTGITAPGLKRNITFDADGHPTMVEEQGIRTTYGFDSERRVTRFEGQGARREFTYEKADRAKTQKLTDTASNAVLFDESYDYDGTGRIRKVTNGGSTWEYTYFPDHTVQSTKLNGQEVNYYQKNSAGLLTYARLLGGSLSVGYANFNSFNGQPQEETTTFIDGRTLVETYSYDSLGRLTGVTRPGNVSTTYGYDDFGNTTSITDGDGVVTRYEYSPSGLPLKTIFDDGSVIQFAYNPDLTLRAKGDIQYVYDAEKMPSQITYPDGVVSKFLNRNRFFEADQVILGSFQQNHTWTDGRLTQVSVPSTSDTLTHTYDGLGRVIDATFNGYTTSLGYSSQHGAVSERSPLGTWSVDVTSDGHITKETYPSGWSLTFSPNSAGLPTALTQAGISSVTWVDLSLPLEIQFVGGMKVKFRYDGALRLTNTTYEAGGQTVAGFNYGLSRGGRVFHEERVHEGAFDVFTRNGAAQGMRITGAAFSATSASGANPSEELRGLQFNGNGEIDFTAAQAIGVGTRTIMPGPGDSLNPNSEGSMSSGPVWIGISQLTPGRFDASFYYDGFNFLERVERMENGQVSVIVTYRRDGQGRVVGKVVAGPADRCEPGEWRYFWKDDQLIEEYQLVAGVPQLLRRYVYLGEDLVVVQAASTPGAALQDYIPLRTHNGSIGGYLTAQGAIIEIIHYGLYGLPEFIGAGGQRMARSGIGSTLLFQGTFFDRETGLCHMGARVLHPVFGKFLQRDPELYADSRALYTAFNGDPLSNIDPGGSAVVDALRERAANWKKVLMTDVKDLRVGSKSSGIAFILKKHSKGFDFASKVTGKLAGIVPSEYTTAIEVIRTVEQGLGLVKHVVSAVEETKVFLAFTLSEHQVARFEASAAKDNLGRKRTALLRASATGMPVNAHNLRKFHSYYKVNQTKGKDWLERRYKFNDNRLNVGKIGAGVVKFLVKDVFHMDESETGVKWVGAAEATVATLDFLDLANKVVKAEQMTALTGTTATLDVGIAGGYASGPLSSVALRGLVFYQAFDFGFSAGKGAITFGLGLTDPIVAKAYYDATKQFSKNGGFTAAAAGALVEYNYFDIAAVDSAANGLRRFAEFDLLQYIGNSLFKPNRSKDEFEGGLKQP